MTVREYATRKPPRDEELKHVWDGYRLFADEMLAMLERDLDDEKLIAIARRRCERARQMHDEMQEDDE